MAASALDREAFTQTITLAALRVPKQRCSDLMKKLRGWDHVLCMPLPRAGRAPQPGGCIAWASIFDSVSPPPPPTPPAASPSTAQKHVAL
jgi:hypothetical protein